MIFRVAALVISIFAVSVAAQVKTSNVILITLDGARTQEIFGGLDAEIFRSVNKNFEKTAAYQRYYGATPTERREKLMPFFWKALMTERGSIAGNRDLKSEVKTTNKLFFSYPGYSEILTGQGPRQRYQKQRPPAESVSLGARFPKQKICSRT